MKNLDNSFFYTCFSKELHTLAVPQGASRRSGASDYVADVLRHIRKDHEFIKTQTNDGSLSSKTACNDLTELAWEITSLMYAAGANHFVWKRWSAITAFGMFLLDRIHEAAKYAALGGEWCFIDALPLLPVKSAQIAEHVLWFLFKRSGKFISPKQPTDSEERAWLGLVDSIPSGRHMETEQSLKEIADFWMGEDEGEWMNYHPGSYPDFETPVCVAAALARHRGFVPKTLSPDQRHFLEAGLAVPEPKPLFTPDMTVSLRSDKWKKL